MINGLYTATSGLLVEMKKMDTISNNLANVNTAGYKADRAVYKTDNKSVNKLKMLGNNQLEKNKTINSCVLLADVYTDMSKGQLKATGNNFDLALNGEGFFVVKDKGELRFTRDGRFQINSEKKLVTASGQEVQQVLGKTGQSINITGTEINIDREGEIYVDGNKIGKLMIVNFDKDMLLEKIGNNLYTFSKGTDVEFNGFKGDVQQGYIELSNVNIIKEMVGMINSVRAFETYQKVIQAQISETAQRLINEVGKA